MDHQEKLNSLRRLHLNLNDYSKNSEFYNKIDKYRSYLYTILSSVHSLYMIRSGLRYQGFEYMSDSIGQKILYIVISDIITLVILFSVTTGD